MSPRFERVVAVLVLAGPLLYMVTNCAPDPALWRYSTGQLLAIVVYTVMAAGVVRSYRWKIHRALAGLRTWLVVLGFSLLSGTLMAELVLRAMHPARFTPTGTQGQYAADPDVGHRYLPNRDQFIVTREYRTPWRTNSQAVRADSDYGPKPPGVYRILAVGDSFTVGDQVTLDKTWPGVLEARLLDAFGPGSVQVVNAGCAGYGTVNEARWIAKFGGRFEPDLVVLAMTPNDLIENHLPLQYSARDGVLINANATEGTRRCSLDHQRWYSIPGYVARSRLRFLLRNMPVYRRLRYGTAYTHYRAYQIDQNESSRNQYERTWTFLLQARDASRTLGARFAIVAICFREQLYRMEPGLSPTIWQERLARFTGEHDIPFADVRPAFMAADDPAALYWAEDSHCTAEGYRIIGETVFSLVRDIVAKGRGEAHATPDAHRATPDSNPP